MIAVTIFYSVLALMFIKSSIESTKVLLRLREQGTEDVRYIFIEDKKYKKIKLYKWVIYNYVALVFILFLIGTTLLDLNWNQYLHACLYITGTLIAVFSFLRNKRNFKRYSRLTET